MRVNSKWTLSLTGMERKMFSVMDENSKLLIAQVYGDDYLDALDNAKMIQMLPRILELLILLSNYKETGPETRFNKDQAIKILYQFAEMGDIILSDRALPGNIVKPT